MNRCFPRLATIYQERHGGRRDDAYVALINMTERERQTLSRWRDIQDARRDVALTSLEVFCREQVARLHADVCAYRPGIWLDWQAVHVPGGRYAAQRVADQYELQEYRR